MSATTALAILGATWLLSGLLLALAMGRHGHDPFAWGLLGTVLGPLAIPLALSTAHRPGPPRLVRQGVAGHGPVDVLVGIDGSPEAAAALVAALELVGPRLGRLTLAGVTGLDDSVERRRHEARLQAELQRQSLAVQAWLAGHATARAAGFREPEVVLCAGRPDEALQQLALRRGYDLLVVGTRGAGMSAALLGSVAASMASGSKVPVLLASGRSPSGLVTSSRPDSARATVGASPPAAVRRTGEQGWRTGASR